MLQKILKKLPGWPAIGSGAFVIDAGISTRIRMGKKYHREVVVIAAAKGL